MKQGKWPVIYGDGFKTRDFVSVMDVVKSNILVMKNKKSDGEIYNISSGKKTSVLVLVKTINNILNTNLQPIHDSERQGDVTHS